MFTSVEAGIHKSMTHTVLFNELSPDRPNEFWDDCSCNAKMSLSLD